MLFDRGQELETLTTWWQRIATDGRSAIVLIEGSPGIGKTSLVNHWIKPHQDAGVLVLQGRCDDYAAAPLDPLRWAVDSATIDPADVEAQEALRRCQEALRYSVEMVPPTRTIGDLILEVVSAAAKGQPAILVIEDIHIADEDTLQTCALLARTVLPPVLLIVTLRPTQGRSCKQFEAFADRRADSGNAIRIKLDALSHAGVEELISTTIGRPAAQGELEAVMAASGGNPLFAKLTLQSLQATLRAHMRQSNPAADAGNQAAFAADSPAAPASLDPLDSDLLRRFVATGSLEAKIGSVLAVFGRFLWDEVPLLADLSGTETAEVNRGLSLLSDRGVLTFRDHGPEWTHPLVREAFEELLAPHERLQVHADLARNLATRSDTPERSPLFEAATHLVAANCEKDVADLSTLLRAAAAVMWVSPALAAAWFEQVRRSDQADQMLHARALIGELTSLTYSGRSQAAWNLSYPTLKMMPPESWLPEQVEMTLLVAFSTGNLVEGIALYEDTPPRIRTSTVEAIGGFLLCMIGDGRKGLETYLRTIAEVERDPESHPSPSLVSLLGSAVLLSRVADLVGLRTLLLQRAADASPADRSYLLAAVDMASMHFPASIEPVQVDLAQDRTAISMGGGREVNQSMQAFFWGDWDQVMSEAPALIELLRSTGNGMAASMPACCAASISVEREEWDEAEEFLAHALWPIDTFHGPMMACAQARIEWARGNREAAIERLQQAYIVGPQDGILAWHTMVVDQLSLMLGELGRHDEAAAVAQNGAQLVRPLGIPLLDAYGQLALGRTLGEAPVLLAALRSAKLARLPLIESRCDALLGSLGNDPKIRLTRAHATFKTLGAVTERIRTEQVMRDQGVPTPRGRGGADHLTPVESAIVRQLLAGKTNRQIAESLHYSPKTIEMHLSRIYARTGKVGRVELVRAVSDGAVALAEESI